MSHGTFPLSPATRTPPRRWSCRKLLRRECEGCQCPTLSPGACSSEPRWYTQRTESPLHSGIVGRSPATLKNRIPINLPGHAHADSLSFELSIRGNRVLVNSGTSEYRIGAERLRQRGTAAHNTLVIEGQDSSEVLVGLPRCASCAPFIGLSCRSVGGTAIVECSHDGYRRLRRGQRLTTLMEWD